MNKLHVRLLTGVFLLTTIGLAVWWSTRPTLIAVTLVQVERGRVESTVSNTRAGTVEACQRTRLSPILGGRIEYLGVKEGDRVRKGQTLLRLWSQDLSAQVHLAEAGLATARQRVDEACIVADNAEREAERATSLRSAGFVSIEREEAARTQARARRAACDTARSDVAQAAARLAAARTELQRTVLVAPFDGIVAKLTGELGEYTTPSPPGVATPPAIDLIDDRCLYISAPMDEVDAPKIRVGQPARISLDALPGKHFPGKVRRIAPYVLALEKQTRTVDVEVDFDHPETVGHLLVGYSADAEVILAVRQDTLRIPTSAVLEGNRVLVYRAATGDLEERVIRTGLANWEYTEVLEGLGAGERIVLSLEREGVKAGAKVMPEAQGQGARPKGDAPSR